MIRPIYMILN